MKQTFAMAIVAFFLVPAALVAQVPRCQGEFQNPWDTFKNRGEFVAAVKRAEPDSNLFVPRPFPKTDDQVMENLRYAYGRIWADETRVPEDELRLYQEFDGDQLTFTVHRVENWTPHRCNELRPREFFYVVRAFSEAGPELARFVFHPSGLLSRYVTIAAEVSEEQMKTGVFPAVESAVELIRARLRIEGAEAHLVSAFGQGVTCDVLAPCVILRDGEAHYLVDPKGNQEFYLLETAEERVPLQDGHSARRSGMVSPERALITAGDQWIPARRMPKP